MPLPRPVRFFSQNAGPDGPPIDDLTGCWYACAQIMRVYYGGSYARPERLPELDNPDGTHKPLGGDALRKFQTNERLQPLSITTPLNTASDFDAVLTESGPIMFSWWVPGPEVYTCHVSVIVGILDKDVRYHDPAVGPNQSMSATMLNLRRMGPMGRKDPMLVRDPKLRWAESIPKELVLASDGVDKKYPLPWPTGWWRVWDGGTWYYYLGDNGIAMSSKTPPSNPPEPPTKAKVHNTGKWVRTPPKTLVITWKQVVGAPKPCEETFWNAVEECERMDANSNLYSAPVATRFRGVK